MARSSSLTLVRASTAAQHHCQLTLVTGISHAYGGVLSALSIDYTLTPLAKDPKKPHAKRWKEREVVKAVYMTHEEVLATTQREVVGDF